MPTRRIIIAPVARKDLRGIWNYLAVQASPDVADRVLADIHDALLQLVDTPGIGHFRSDVRDPRYRFWSVRSYVIAYRCTSRTLHVAHVVHGRRDFPRLFP